MALLWETGIRIGAANSIDLQDVHLQDEYIDLVHRREAGTTRQNGKTGERPVAITSGLAEVLGEYIEHRRIDVGDSYGRETLLTSENGRYSRTAIRMSVYLMTAACFRDEQVGKAENAVTYTRIVNVHGLSDDRELDYRSSIKLRGRFATLVVVYPTIFYFWAVEAATGGWNQDDNQSESAGCGFAASVP